MNRKLSLTIITLCSIAMVSLSSFSVRGDTVTPAIPTPMALTTEDGSIFPLPDTSITLRILSPSIADLTSGALPSNATGKFITSSSDDSALPNTQKPTATPRLITSEVTQFSIPTTNGTVNFAQTGFYENAALSNDTWAFTHLYLDTQQPDLLSDSSTTANLNISAQDCNVTVNSLERLLTPNGSDYQNNGSWLTAGWLNYTASGVGRQIIKIQFNLANWTVPSQDDINGTYTWPMGVQVYIDGKEAQYNNSWTTINGIIPYGTGLIVNNANSNVSIKYAWVPVPAPASQSLSSPNLETTKASPETPPMFYIMIVAVASGIIVPAAVFTNRHRLESIINKRIKRKS